jgi:hypothetical protein
MSQLPNRIEIIVDGLPPKKSKADSCWGNKSQAPLLYKLRLKLFEGRSNAGLKECFHVPVKLELTIFGPNITQVKGTHNYIGDLDSFVAGVFETLQASPNNPDAKIHQSLRDDSEDGKEIGKSVPLIIENDALITSVTAKKIKSEKSYYKLAIGPDSS